MALGTGEKGIYFKRTEEKGQNLKGTGEQRQYCGTGNIRKQNFRFLGNMGTSQLISGEKDTRFI